MYVCGRGRERVHERGLRVWVVHRVSDASVVGRSEGTREGDVVDGVVKGAMSVLSTISPLVLIFTISVRFFLTRSLALCRCVPGSLCSACAFDWLVYLLLLVSCVCICWATAMVERASCM